MYPLHPTPQISGILGSTLGKRICSWRSTLEPGTQVVSAGSKRQAWSPPCQRQAKVQAEEVWG
jgi:hypothetical protein